MSNAKGFLTFKDKKILLGISGSISAYKVCEVISKLVQEGAQVKVIATPSALKFVGKATLEGISGESVFVSDFVDGSMMAHIRLAQWADVFLIAPATAQTLNALANGVGHSLLVTTFLAYDLAKPLLVAPAMNPVMLHHPSTQSSLEKLKTWGAQMLWGDAGRMACGDEGLGRLQEPKEILKALEQLFTKNKSTQRILITAGGTREPIDSVRSITNTSTGSTGAQLAMELQKLGHDVHLITSQFATKAPGVTTTTYITFNDLEKNLKHHLSSEAYDTVIHAAAVSDFSVSDILQNKKSLNQNEKIDSSSDVTITLSPNKKLLSQIKKWTEKPVLLIGFKLTSVKNSKSAKNLIQQAVQKITAQGADLVVHNDLHEIQSQQHPFYIYKNKNLLGMCNGAQELAHFINDQTQQSSKRPKEQSWSSV